MARRLDDRVDRAHERGGDEQRAQPVHSVIEAEPLVGADQRVAEREGGDADREVHEEDPVPAQRLGEQAAGEQADGASGDGYEDVDAHGPGSFDCLGELGDDDRQDHRGLGGGSDPLEEAGPDQRFLARSEPAQQRRDRERDEAGEEHAPAPDEVADAAGQEHRLPKVTRNALTTQVRLPWLK